jgi:PAS domain S-box-containing protein
MRRTLLAIAVGLVATTALSAVYLRLRLHIDGPRLAEAVGVTGLLLVSAAAAAVLLTRHHYRHGLRDLGRRVAHFRGSPTGGELFQQRLTGPATAGDEWVPLVAAVERLAEAYRKALGEMVHTQEALERFRSLSGLADTEGGKSHSFVQGKSAFFRSTRLIARLAPNLHWMAATAALQRVLGRPLHDLNARSFLECVHAEDAPALVQLFQEALREGEGHDITFRLLTHPGPVRHMRVDVLTRYDVDGSPLHLRCHFVDVTDRVTADRELRQQSVQLADANALLRQTNAGLERLKESYRDLYHEAPALYFSLDPQGRFAACNDTLLTALGYTRDDLLGKPYARLLTADSARRFLQDPGAYARTGEIETHWVKSDGSVIDVWVRTAPILDDAGRFVRSRSAAQDVTERNRLANAVRAKAEELQQANERLRRINQELEEFTYVVSHDLKEPLRTLEAFSTFLQQDYGKALGGEGADYISHLLGASRRLGRLIDDLLALSRAGKVINTAAAFDLGEALRVVVADLSDLISRRGAQVRVEGTLPTVVGDRERVGQLLANLVGNGLKYNRSTPPIVVVGVVSTVALPSSATGHPPPVTIFVRDNGIGIAPQYHEQVFRLFRRLHRREEYEGTGAGLAICKKIVEAHGGRIWIESQVGHGATFCFTLPATAVPCLTPSGEEAGQGTRDRGARTNGHVAPAAR